MADHFAKEIFFIITMIFFIMFLITDFTISFEETELEIIELTDDTTFDESWTATGENYRALRNIVPIEFFTLIILPIIILVGYIILKTASGLLPNWLSGG